MSATYSCAHGHRWHGDEQGTDTSQPTCPVCGARGEALLRGGAVRGNPATVELCPTMAQDVRATAWEEGPSELPSIAGFELLGELGRGGMGVVYKAWQVALYRVVALKMVLAGRHAGPMELARFRTEAEAVARLQHPNFVQIHAVGQQDGCPYLALEFVDGPTLAQRLGGKPLPPRQAAYLVQVLARAMHYAHQRGIVHRDLNPANVLIGGAADAPLEHCLPKITDFGLAKLLIGGGEPRTETGTILGSIGYIAPEQARGQKSRIGPATDVYALGAILYESLTGRPPFRAVTPLEVLQQIEEVDPPPPGHLQSGVSHDLDTVCLKCLHKEPARRYGSCEELADDLRRFLAGEPVRARPVGALERVGRWCRRNPAVACLAGAVFLLLLTIAGAASTTALWLREERNTALAHLERAEQAESHLRAEEDFTEHLWGSYLDLTRASRWTGREGQRFGGLDTLGRLAAVRPELRPRLRDEAIACLSLADLRVGKRWGLDSRVSLGPGIAFDHRLERYATHDAEGAIRVFRIEDHREILRLPARGAPIHWVFRFSPDGRFLAARYGEGAEGRLRVWDLDAGKVKLEPAVRVHLGAVDFSRDGCRIALGSADGAIHLHDLAKSAPGPCLCAGLPAYALCFHPDGDRLAVSCHRDGVVQVRDAMSGEVRRELSHPQGVRGLAWSEDGRLLAAACADRAVYVWDLTSAETPRPRLVLRGHHGVVTQVRFSRAGSILASSGWDGMTRLWDTSRGRLLVSAAGEMVADAPFHPTDRWLAFRLSATETGLWEVAVGRGCRCFATDLRRWVGSVCSSGCLLAVASERDVRLWDLAAGVEVARLPVGHVFSAFFSPDRQTFVTSGGDGVQLWPVARGPEEGVLRIGPPRRVALPDGSKPELAALSADGRTLVVRITANRAALIDLSTQSVRVFLEGHPRLYSVAVSPKGEWAATGTWHGAGVKLWNARTGCLVRELNVCGSSLVAFSPDGRWLAIGTGQEYQLWESGSWLPRHRIVRDRAGDLPGPITFTRDGQLMAIALSRYAVQLIQPLDGRPLATLDTANSFHLDQLCFARDGGELVGVSDGVGIRVWDLHRIRRQLSEHGLDWEGPPSPPRSVKRPAAPRVVRIESN